MLRFFIILFFSTLISCVWAESRDADGLTNLQCAAGRGNLSEVKRLLKEGADIYAVDSKMGSTVLHKAVYSGNPAVVALLIQKGALLNLQTAGNGNTPLHDALFFKKKAHGKEIIALLLQAGADLAICNRAGLTPLSAAKLLHDQDAIEQIQKEEARRYTLKGRALMAAVKINDINGVKKLLADPATPIEEADINGFTPLLWAARQGMTQITALLLTRGANPNHLDVWMGANAGHKAAYWGRTAVMKLLVKHHLDINARGTANGYTPLHDAVSANHYETAKVLIEAGARKDIQGHDGLTPFDIAKENANKKMINLLN